MLLSQTGGPSQQHYCPTSNEIIALFKQRHFEVTQFIGDAATKGNDHISALANSLDESLGQIQGTLHGILITLLSLRVSNYYDVVTLCDVTVNINN